MDKEQIVKILKSYVFDNVGETRPYIDPESINDIATEIVSSSNGIQNVGGISVERDGNYYCKTCGNILDR